MIWALCPDAAMPCERSCQALSFTRRNRFFVSFGLLYPRMVSFSVSFRLNKKTGKNGDGFQEICFSMAWNNSWKLQIQKCSTPLTVLAIPLKLRPSRVRRTIRNCCPDLQISFDVTMKEISSNSVEDGQYIQSKYFIKGGSRLTREGPIFWRSWDSKLKHDMGKKDTNIQFPKRVSFTSQLEPLRFRWLKPICKPTKVWRVNHGVCGSVCILLH